MARLRRCAGRVSCDVPRPRKEPSMHRCVSLAIFVTIASLFAMRGGGAAGEGQGAGQRRLRDRHRVHQPGRPAPAARPGPAQERATDHSRPSSASTAAASAPARARATTGSASRWPSTAMSPSPSPTGWPRSIRFPAAIHDCQGGGPLAAGQRGEIPHRPRPHRRHRRFGRRPPGAVPRRHGRT